MPSKSLSIMDLRDLINKGEAKDPLVFLESIMNGQDPRRLSSIYELVNEIDSFSNGELSKSDWSEIVAHVCDRFKYHTVPLGDSLAASKTLAEYLHAKRKQVEITGNQDGSVNSSNNPLSEEEIELFKEKFNDEF
jgi:hypothetical protein